MADIEQRIQAACRRSGRAREVVQLVAVTKTIEPEKINEALSAGITVIGENRVQEYLAKREYLQPHAFHLIGHLQRNKVKQILPLCDLIHSVDTIRLAEEINKRSLEQQRITNILLEVNISSEDSKFGVSPEQLPATVEAVFAMPHVRLLGLMTVAEQRGSAESLRPSFRRMRELLEDLNRRHHSRVPMTQLSMGMTGDFEIAIEEGATIIRIGTALFGQRGQ